VSSIWWLDQSYDPFPSVFALDATQGGINLSSCLMVGACTFFDDQMSDMPGMAKLIQTQYCQNDFGNCARFIVSSALGMGSVPGTLFPGHLDKARHIVADSAE